MGNPFHGNDIIGVDLCVERIKDIHLWPFICTILLPCATAAAAAAAAVPFLQRGMGVHGWGQAHLWGKRSPLIPTRQSLSPIQGSTTAGDVLLCISPLRYHATKHQISLVAIPLVNVQIHDHDAFRQPFLQEHPDRDTDICIDTEASTLVSCEG